MKIIGIDPGYDRLGIAVINATSRGKEILLFSTCIQTSSKDTIYKRFEIIGKKLSDIIDEYKPDIMAIETLFISKNQKTAMRVSEARGIIIYEGLKHGLDIREYGPMEIKMAITSDGKSDKERIIKMIPLLIQMPKRDKNDVALLDDEYDAIAVSLTCSAMLKNG